jgi:ubiquinone/menaquinone biosynthesis C-methylase UbiE
MHILPEPRLALQEMKRVLKDDGKIILPTYLHGANLQSKILSLLMGISGFRARNRWSVASFREFVTSNGFHISKEKVMPDKIPLMYMVAQKR